jgi:Zn-dependent protease with chaperone function
LGRTAGPGFVIGHELGHVALGHTRLSTLVGGLLGVPTVPFFSAFLLPAFLWWSRCAEYSADRAGLIACGELDKSIAALLKVMVGPKLAEHVDIGEVITQSVELTGSMDALVGEATGTHPFLVHRLRELVKFWESPECHRLLANEEENHVG